MAMVGFLHSTIARLARSPMALYSRIASREPRFCSNSEMSAPEMKALPPLPASTTARMASSALNASRISGTAFHMSTETALCRAGLLNSIQPTAPSLRAIIRSVLVFMARLRLYDLLLVQVRDHLVVEAELAQHLVGVLALVGRRIAHAARRAGELHRLVDHLDITEPRMMHGRRHAEMAHLRVGEHLVHLVDRAARHAGLVEDVDPVAARLVTRDLRDFLVEGGAVLRAQLVARVVGVGDELRRADRLAEALVDVGAGRRDVDVPVAGRKHAGRDAGRVIVAGLAGHVLGDQPARRLEIEQLDLRLQQGRAHPLALARHLALEQGDEDAGGAENAGAEVGQR